MADADQHDDLRELLGVYAVGAVDEHERRVVAAHLKGCAPCRADSAALGTVANHLRSLAGVGAATTGPVVDRRRRLRLEAIGLAGLAVAVGVAGALLVRERSETEDIREQLASARNVLGVLEEAGQGGGRDARLAGAGGTAELVVLADGRAVLWRDDLPSLAPSEAYHLWGAVGGDVVSAGSLGSDPRVVVRSVPSSVTALLITRGPADQAQPTDPVVATGPVDGA